MSDFILFPTTDHLRKYRIRKTLWRFTKEGVGSPDGRPVEAILPCDILRKDDLEFLQTQIAQKRRHPEKF